jgi:hypothetical protein
MEIVETMRRSFRPERITTLFVGESAPHSGDFFYCGNTGMQSHMRKAVEQAFGPTNDFLKTFQGYGWYLDDLVLEPVNEGFSPLERRAKCQGAIESLAKRIEIYQPQAIVSALKTIESFVADAATRAQSSARRYCVPFAGNSHQTKFGIEMAAIIRKLPRISAAARLKEGGA